MFDEILKNLKSEVGTSLTDKLGLKPEQADSTFSTALESLKNVVTKEAGSNGITGLMNLFSNDGNNDAANSISEKFSTAFGSDLVSKVGLSNESAGSVKDMIIPIIMKLFSGKINGDSANLASMFGADNMMDGAMDKMKDKLGGLTGMFK